MDDIADLVTQIYQKGLPRISADIVLGKDGKPTLFEGNGWKEIHQILYKGEGKDETEGGLLVALEKSRLKVFETVKAAWDQAEKSRVLLADLTASLKGQPISPSELVPRLQDAWATLNTATEGLEALHAPLKQTSHLNKDSASSEDQPNIPSTFQEFLVFLSKANSGEFNTLKQHLDSIIRDFDAFASARVTLENDYERRRLEGRKLFSDTTSFLTHSDCRLRNIRSYWHAAKLANGYASAYHLWAGEGKLKDLLPYNDYLVLIPQLIKYIGEVQQVTTATINNGVATPSDQTKMEPNPDVSTIRGGAVRSLLYRISCKVDPTFKGGPLSFSNEHVVSFDKYICQQQSILNALGAAGGPWAGEDDLKARVDLAGPLRDRLGITLDNLAKISNLVQRFQNEVVALVLRDIPRLKLDIQDLHASIHFGNDQDQKEATANLIASVAAWSGILKHAQEQQYKRFPGTFVSKHFSNVSSTGGWIPTNSAESNFSRLIYGLDVIDADYSNPLSLKIEGFPTAPPKIQSWNNTRLTFANGRCVELPKTGLFDFGTVTTDGQDVQLHRNPHVTPGVDIRVPVRFKTNFSNRNIKVVAWINGLSCLEANYRVAVRTEKENSQGFTMVLTTWWDTKLDWLSAGWFAYPVGPESNVASGQASFRKRGMQSGALCDESDSWAPCSQVKFRDVSFTSIPNVFAAVSKLDMSRSNNPRLRIGVDNVTKEGLRVSANHWYDTDCYESEAVYIAFGDRFFQSQ